MAADLVKLPLTLFGDQGKTIGFVMIEHAALNEIEPYPMMWGIRFDCDVMRGKVLSIDVYGHVAEEKKT